MSAPESPVAEAAGAGRDPSHRRAGLTAPRDIGAVNWLGLWTLYSREVQRFLKIVGQTVLAPVVTTLLFLAIFSLALGRSVEMVNGLPFLVFLAPGLITMGMVQNSFASPSSSIIILKIQGNIVDMLMPPLSAGELTAGFALGGMTRGLLVGASIALAMWVFVPLRVEHPVALLYFAFSAALLLSLIGVIAGICGTKFDHIAFVTNFIVTPFAFLSGTFYSVDRLPGMWNLLAHANPFFFMINGVRYGFTGMSDGNLLLGGIVLFVLNAVLWFVCVRLFAAGFRLKS